jgi:serine/threonine protein kinase HipA of HipAB toxin-antitoxin module
MRTTISLDDRVADLAAKIQERENRTFSNLVEVALTAYCAQSEKLDEVATEAASAAEAGSPEEVVAILRDYKAQKYSSDTAAAEAAGGGK